MGISVENFVFMRLFLIYVYLSTTSLFDEGEREEGERKGGKGREFPFILLFLFV